ncbi:hypothetical protein JCM3765_005384 [Sporobolomyces pararoseus]
MASLHRSLSLSRAFRALSFHPPISRSSRTASHLSNLPHLGTLVSSTSRSQSPRRPKVADTLPFHQYLYSIGYPEDSFDDLTPPPANTSREEMSLPAPRTLIAIGGDAQAYSMTNKSIVYTCKRHDMYSYSCSCPAWKTQIGKPPDARSCKHLRSLLGDAHENARCDESKKTVVYTPETNPVNLKKKAREEALAGAAGSTSKPHKKRPATSILDSDSIDSAASTSAPKRTRQASSSSKSKSKEDEDLSENIADVDNIKPGGVSGGRDLLLAHKFDLDGKIDPKGWWISEKLDGVRAYWDGQTTLWSRTGKALSAPQNFLAHLPRGRTLDGELYIGRNRFDETSGIVREVSMGSIETSLASQVFDAPFLSSSPFEDRLACLESLFPSLSLEEIDDDETKAKVKSPVVLVKHEICQGMEDLKKKLVEVQNLGGEGLMLRQPGSQYVGKRSKTLLKVKTFYDAEAKVVGYEAGKGKYEGMTGSLICQMEDGRTTFSVGSGLTDERRQSPPAIGSIVTYRFFELTKQNIPRFPTFVGERVDADRAKDASIREKDEDTMEVGGSKSKGKGKSKT